MSNGWPSPVVLSVCDGFCRALSVVSGARGGASPRFWVTRLAGPSWRGGEAGRLGPVVCVRVTGGGLGLLTRALTLTVAALDTVCGGAALDAAGGGAALDTVCGGAALDTVCVVERRSTPYHLRVERVQNGLLVILLKRIYERFSLGRI